MTHFKLAIFSLCFLNALSASADTKPASGSWGETTEYGKLLKAGQRESTEGKVLSFKEITPLEGMEPGVEMKFDTGKSILDVHLGPRWFVMERDLNITRGERLSIVGLRIQIDKKPVFVAEEISREGKSTVIRESSGNLKREVTHEPSKDLQMEALTVLTKRCAGCHQTKDHPGAKFLSAQGLSDKDVVKKLIRVIETGKMPPAHSHFAASVEGKLVLDWLKTQK